MVLFGNTFTKVMSQHADSEYNGTHLIQCRRVKFKTILNKENREPSLQSSKLIFPPNLRYGKIDYQIQLTSTRLKCELLEIVRQILRV